MSGEYEKAIYIGKAIQNIVSRWYLLPVIQRKFTWSTSQIAHLHPFREAADWPHPE